MLFAGFRFGMLLQLAVGPICIFIFRAASTKGFISALAGVMGVALADGLYILAAIAGLGALIEKRSGAKVTMRLFGGAVLLFYGLATASGAFGLRMLPKLEMPAWVNVDTTFLHALFLTLSSPLSIVFWAGVFSAKISESDFSRAQIRLFGLGAVLSTLVSLTAVAALGAGVRPFLSPSVMQGMNLTVGVVLIGFGLRMLLPKRRGQEQDKNVMQSRAGRK